MSDLFLELGKEIADAIGLSNIEVNRDSALFLISLKTCMELALMDRQIDIAEKHKIEQRIRWLQVPDESVSMIFNKLRLINKEMRIVDKIRDISVSYPEEFSHSHMILLILSTIDMALSDGDYHHNENLFLLSLCESLGIDASFIPAGRGLLQGQISHHLSKLIAVSLERMASDSVENSLLKQLAQELLNSTQQAQSNPGKALDLNLYYERQADLLNIAKNLDSIIKRNGVFHVFTLGLKGMRRMLENSQFRIAFIGEFKRGKSTLINALTRYPELLPTHTLPCTSQIIEIQWGASEGYGLLRSSTSELEPSNREEFCRGAVLSSSAQLNAKAKSSTEGEGDPEHSGSVTWVVTVPSSSLTQGVCFIDTPGLGEHADRDKITQYEIDRSDAVVAVLSARQALSEKELDTISERVLAKQRGMVVALNDAHMPPADDLPLVIQRICTSLELETDKVVPLSALEAVKLLKAGQQEGIWLTQVDKLNQCISTTLMANAAGWKLRSAKAKIDQLIQDLQQEIVRRRASQEKNSNELRQDRVNAEIRFKLLQQSLEILSNDLHKAGQSIGEQILTCFKENWPKILSSMAADATTWKVDPPPSNEKGIIAKYIAHVTDLIKQSTLHKFDKWNQEMVTPMIIEAMSKQRDSLKQVMDDLARYLDVKDTNMSNMLHSEIVKLAIPNIENTVANNTIKALTQAAIVTMIAQTISASVITLMSKLLAAHILVIFTPAFLAVLAGLIASSIAGATFFASRIKTKLASNVAAKVKERLVEKQIVDKIGADIKKICAEQFEQVATNLSKEIKELTDQVQHNMQQSQSHAEQSDQHLAVLISAQSNLEAEIAKIREKLNTLTV